MRIAGRLCKARCFNMQNQAPLGAPITLDECGFYIAHNRVDGTVNSVFNLRYENDNWLLSQLKHVAATDDADETLFWTNLGDGEDDTLQSMPTAEMQQWFYRPELQHLPGGWQVLRNARFGFGKFTPIMPNVGAANLHTSYALLRFRDGQMLGPILIEKTVDSAIVALGELGF
jgi:hypothetical protein